MIKTILIKNIISKNDSILKKYIIKYKQLCFVYCDFVTKFHKIKCEKNTGDLRFMFSDIGIRKKPVSDP